MSSPRTCSCSKPGIVKLLDLGFGELVGMAGQAGNVFDTDEGIVVGTTDFMSPEQVQNKGIDARTDLFSLGCTMYRLLTADLCLPRRDQGGSAHQADPGASCPDHRRPAGPLVPPGRDRRPSAGDPPGRSLRLGRRSGGSP